MFLKLKKPNKALTGKVIITETGIRKVKIKLIIY
jgi:hypothetical protein